MKILGLDSSGLVAGAAVVEDGTLLAEYNINYKKTHSQTLLPMLDELRRMLNLELDTLDAIAVASGPGSFTGLRIGSATAKGLGFALEKPLVEVPTLEGLAYNLWGTADLVCPLIDARRGQVYTGIYEFVRADGREGAGGEESGREGSCHGAPRVLMPQAAADILELIEEVNRLGETCPGRGVVFLGDGVPVYRERLLECVEIPLRFAPASCARQRAGSIAALGAVYYAEGRTVSAGDHKPEYLRKSQAEREQIEKEQIGQIRGGFVQSEEPS